MGFKNISLVVFLGAGLTFLSNADAYNFADPCYTTITQITGTQLPENRHGFSGIIGQRASFRVTSSIFQNGIIQSFNKGTVTVRFRIDDREIEKNFKYNDLFPPIERLDKLVENSIVEIRDDSTGAKTQGTIIDFDTNGNASVLIPHAEESKHRTIKTPVSRLHPILVDGTIDSAKTSGSRLTHVDLGMRISVPTHDGGFEDAVVVDITQDGQIQTQRSYHDWMPLSEKESVILRWNLKEEAQPPFAKANVKLKLRDGVRICASLADAVHHAQVEALDISDGFAVVRIWPTVSDQISHTEKIRIESLIPE